jgi:hypothetical protein
MGMDALLLEIKYSPPGPKMVHSRSEMREDERGDMNILLLQAQLQAAHEALKQAGDACHLGSSSILSTILRPIRDLVHC